MVHLSFVGLLDLQAIAASEKHVPRIGVLWFFLPVFVDLWLLSDEKMSSGGTSGKVDDKV